MNYPVERFNQPDSFILACQRGLFYTDIKIIRFPG